MVNSISLLSIWCRQCRSRQSTSQNPLFVLSVTLALLTLGLSSTLWQIALRREKPGGRTITSPPQDVSKLDSSSEDEDESTPSAADASNNTLSPVPKNYDPAPDVSILPNPG